MTGKDILMGLSEIDVDLIREAEFGAAPRRKGLRRPLLLAAVIAMTALLVGCGVVYALRMADLELGQTPLITDVAEDGTLVTRPLTVLSLSGIQGSPGYQAAAEYLQVQNTQGFQAARAQEAAIAEKYGLKLPGDPVQARTAQSLLRYLGIDSLLVPGAAGTLSPMAAMEAEYYENGCFYADFNLRLEDGGWPYDTLCCYYYSPKDCFSDQLCLLENTGDWKEWNHTTPAGEEVLILHAPSQDYAWAFRDQEDAMVSLRIQAARMQDERMTSEQLQQVVDCFDFSPSLKPGAPALLEGAPAGGAVQSGVTVALKQVQTDGEIVRLTLGITAPEGMTINTQDQSIATGNWTGQLASEDGTQYPIGWQTGEDGDGLDNTQNLILQASAGTIDGSGFRGDGWSLYMEDLLFFTHDREQRQSDLAYRAEGVWRFDLDFSQGAFREVEFVQEPVTVAVSAPEEAEAEAKLISLKLRRFSGSLEFEAISGLLGDGTLILVLEDGQELELYHNPQPGKLHPIQVMEEIPLEQVKEVRLPDGQVLGAVK